ncbi:MAG: hypothetical protein ACJZ2B_08330 [Candidatus Neomarinimicrobiota bacterium]
MIALKLGRRIGVAKNRGQNLIKALNQVDDNVRLILDDFDSIKLVAEKTCHVR